MSYKEKLQPMDIIVVYNPKSWLHRIIAGVTQYKAGHVAIYVGDNMIYEAGSTGVKRKSCKEYTEKCKIYICRYKEMTEIKEMLIRNYLFKKENDKYSFFQLGMMLIGYFFKISNIPDVSKKAEICSELVAEAYKFACIPLCKKESWQTYPGDILYSDKIWRIKCQ